MSNRGCIYSGCCKKSKCTEPRDVRLHLTRLLCGTTGETLGQRYAPNRLDYFVQIENTFDQLFVNRGDSVNLGNCFYPKKFNTCHIKKVKPLKL